MNLINGVPGDTIGINDRGLLYGDGVFRTLLRRSGVPLLWDRQYAKLASDCSALRIECPSQSVFERDFDLLPASDADCVIKLIVTRGDGPRGYVVPANTRANRVVTCGPLPAHAHPSAGSAARIRWCNTSLSVQPALAGVKHLNRLENVLARSEWHDPTIFDGLMLTAGGEVISGTMRNLFLVRNGQLNTPAIDRCGVDGVMRKLVLELAAAHQVPVIIGTVRRQDVQTADEIFLVNSVITLVAVGALETTKWTPGPLSTQIQRWIVDAQSH